MARRKTSRWQACNVLLAGEQIRHLWQFNARGGKFNLLRQESRLPSEPLNPKLIAKNWGTLVQPRLNIAWLNTDQVFLRVVQLPRGDTDETRSMVDLQLEKISPLPVTQIVWSFMVLPWIKQPGVGQEMNPHAAGEQQTVVVIMAERDHVEKFLGQLEGQGYMADQLELPLVDELRATQVQEDGVWIYPGVGGVEGACMVAWWYGGVLQNLGLTTLPAGERRATVLQELLAQTIWAGELEGWLTSAPKVHLVADDATAAAWRPLFDLTQQPTVVPPATPQELSAATARRVATDGGGSNLLPPEYTVRYKGLFADKLVLSSIGAIIALYLACVLVYFGFVFAQSVRYEGLDLGFYEYKGVQQHALSTSLVYTNTIQRREELRVLRDTLDLQYAALECYRSISDNLPAELTLNSMRFEQGRKVTFSGSASKEDKKKITDLTKALAKVQTGNRTLYAFPIPQPTITDLPGAQSLSWNFSCDLKRADDQ